MGRRHSPVPITLDYTAHAHGYTDAHAFGMLEWFSGPDDQTDDTLNELAQAYAHSDAWGDEEWLEIDPDTGEEWLVPIPVSDIFVDASAMAVGSEHPFGATLSSQVGIEMWGWGEAYCEATADTSLDATVGIGISPQFPLGAGGLTVHMGVASSGSLVSPWSISIVSTDPANPIDLTLDNTTPQIDLPVLAGQTLSVLLADSVDVGPGNLWDIGTVDLGRRIDVEFAVTPEPATLTLLTGRFGDTEA